MTDSLPAGMLAACEVVEAEARITADFGEGATRRERRWAEDRLVLVAEARAAIKRHESGDRYNNGVCWCVHDDYTWPCPDLLGWARVLGVEP